MTIYVYMDTYRLPSQPGPLVQALGSKHHSVDDRDPGREERRAVAVWAVDPAGKMGENTRIGS